MKSKFYDFGWQKGIKKISFEGKLLNKIHCFKNKNKRCVNLFIKGIF